MVIFAFSNRTLTFGFIKCPSDSKRCFKASSKSLVSSVSAFTGSFLLRSSTPSSSTSANEKSAFLFNPDKYIDSDGKTIDIPLKKRMSDLHSEVNKQINRILHDENNKTNYLIFI